VGAGTLFKVQYYLVEMKYHYLDGLFTYMVKR